MSDSARTPDFTTALAALTPAQRSLISKMSAATVVACIEELATIGRARLAGESADDLTVSERKTRDSEPGLHPQTGLHPRSVA